MTKDELKAARAAFGLSADAFGRLVGVEGGRTVRRWESGEREIPGPVAVLTEALLASAAVRDHLGVTLQSPNAKIRPHPEG